MTKANAENMAEIKGMELPSHLKKMLTDRIKKADKIGIDPEWATKARREADRREDDFNPIHAMI